MRNSLIIAAALAAIASVPVSAADIACPEKITPELVTSLGDPVGWLVAGQTVHAAPGLTMIGHQIAYVLATRASGAADAPIIELAYRFQGVTRPFGQRFSVDVRKDFEKGFTGSNCSSGNAQCVVDYKASAPGDLSGAELSEGIISIPKSAHGDGLGPVKADYNLDSADPVFLVCHYQPPK